MQAAASRAPGLWREVPLEEKQRERRAPWGHHCPRPHPQGSRPLGQAKGVAGVARWPAWGMGVWSPRAGDGLMVPPCKTVPALGLCSPVGRGPPVLTGLCWLGAGGAAKTAVSSGCFACPLRGNVPPAASWAFALSLTPLKDGQLKGRVLRLSLGHSCLLGHAGFSTASRVLTTSIRILFCNFTVLFVT